MWLSYIVVVYIVRNTHTHNIYAKKTLSWMRRSDGSNIDVCCEWSVFFGIIGSGPLELFKAVTPT